MTTKIIKTFYLATTADKNTKKIITKDYINKMKDKLYDEMRKKGRWLIGIIEEELFNENGIITLIVSGRFAYIGRKAIKKYSHSYFIKEPISTITF